MSSPKILYIASEIDPFFKVTPVATIMRILAQNMVSQGAEVRIFIPKFGLINERSNRLHEVMRLSGINIPLGQQDKLLILKVASIREAKLQVYFIDNEEYFQRKGGVVDKAGHFYLDNDERAIFFCKGVLEVVKQLGWAPDIIHAQDWFTSFVPMYLKTYYHKEPVFQQAKVLWSIYNHPFSHSFVPTQLLKKAQLPAMPQEALDNILLAQDFAGFMELGMRYADAVAYNFEPLSSPFTPLFKKYPSTYIADDAALDGYQALYSMLK